MTDGEGNQNGHDEKDIDPGRPFSPKEREQLRSFMDDAKHITWIWGMARKVAFTLTGAAAGWAVFKDQIKAIFH
jgi:hypothetical protein